MPLNSKQPSVFSASISCREVDTPCFCSWHLTAHLVRTGKQIASGLTGVLPLVAWWSAIAAGPIIAAAPQGSAFASEPRTDKNSQLAHEELIEKAKQDHVDVYFIGDSITRRWGATDYPQFLAHWNKTFFGWNAGDFGWGADRIQNMLWRLENGEFEGMKPKVIVVLAGTNNIGHGPVNDAKVAEVTDGIKALIDFCQHRAPSATIILTAIFPRNDSPGLMPGIERINHDLAGLADGKSVRFLNVNDKFADADGVLFEGMTMDKLHPTLKGYEAWAAGLRPILTELLGPPASTDQAPPPTGDPSARKK